MSFITPISSLKSFCGSHWLIEAGVVSFTWHRPLPVFFLLIPFLLLFCLYTLLQPNQLCHLTAITCSRPFFTTLFHLPELRHGFPSPHSYTVLEVKHYSCFLHIQTSVPLEESAPGWRRCQKAWRLLKTKWILGQVNLPGLLSLQPEDEDIENKHLSPLLGRSNEMMNGEELCE